MNYPYHSLPPYYHPYYQSLSPYSSQPSSHPSSQPTKPAQPQPHSSTTGQHRQLTSQGTYPNYHYPNVSNPPSYPYPPTPYPLAYSRPTLQPQAPASNQQQQIVIEISD